MMARSNSWPFRPETLLLTQAATFVVCTAVHKVLGEILSQLAKMRMDHPDLTRLLEESGCHVIFNKVQLQKMANDVQTCGRHCVCRLLYYRLPIGKYRQMIHKSGMTPDEFVVAKTYNNLGK